jgi:hypothetical protein
MSMTKNLLISHVLHFHGRTFFSCCRRRSDAESVKRVKRQARQNSDEDEDGGFTREAAIVSPIRR